MPAKGIHRGFARVIFIRGCCHICSTIFLAWRWVRIARLSGTILLGLAAADDGVEIARWGEKGILWGLLRHANETGYG